MDHSLQTTRLDLEPIAPVAVPGVPFDATIAFEPTVGIATEPRRVTRARTLSALVDVHAVSAVQAIPLDAVASVRPGEIDTGRKGCRVAHIIEALVHVHAATRVAIVHARHVAGHANRTLEPALHVVTHAEGVSTRRGASVSITLVHIHTAAAGDLLKARWAGSAEVTPGEIDTLHARVADFSQGTLVHVHTAVARRCCCIEDVPVRTLATLVAARGIGTLHQRITRAFDLTFVDVATPVCVQLEESIWTWPTDGFALDGVTGAQRIITGSWATGIHLDTLDIVDQFIVVGTRETLKRAFQVQTGTECIAAG
jgi:hypothetical protein